MAIRSTFNPDIETQPSAWVWNNQFDEAQKAARASSMEYLEALREAARNYPALDALLKTRGVMKQDGSIDWDGAMKKFGDQGFLQELKNQLYEINNSASQESQRNLTNAQMRDTSGASAAATANLAQTLANTQRGNVREYAGQVKREREGAYTKGLNLARQEQADVLKKSGLELNADQMAAQLAAQRAQAQTRGLLQDPRTYSTVAGAIASAINPVLGAVVGGVGGAITNAMVGSDDSQRYTDFQRIGNAINQGISDLPSQFSRGGGGGEIDSAFSQGRARSTGGRQTRSHRQVSPTLQSTWGNVDPNEPVAKRVKNIEIR